MNKKYIDFVPVKSQEKTVKKGATRGAAKAPATETAEFVMSEVFKERVEKVRAGVTATKQPNVAAPRAKFVNTEKVAKRPLSKSAKNVYTKKIVEPQMESTKPVRIISQPEKDSKMGLVAAIIITIILGAAAGTVAFLLLPK